MIDRRKLIDWANALHPKSTVGIDDDGIALIEIDKSGDETGAYLEVGGIPRVGPDDFPEADSTADICGECHGSGWLLFKDEEIQRCDECQRYSGDLDAAIAYFTSGKAKLVLDRITLRRPPRTATPGLTVSCPKCVGIMPGISISPERIECFECGTAI